MVQPAIQDPNNVLKSQDALKPPKLIAYCTRAKNIITLVDFETKQKYAEFQGATIQGYDGN